jgi:cation/acetate symporter
MVGTAGLPHVIVRFYTVKRVRDARWSAGWALLFIAILYTTAPAVAAFSKYNILANFQSLGSTGMAELEWVRNWAQTGLIDTSGWAAGLSAQELLASIDRDIIVLATPEIAGLSAWVIGLVAAGGLAAALSTASGLLLVISSALAHDVYGKMINPDAPDHVKLRVGRLMIFLAVIVAGYFGMNPPGFVAEVVAFAFGLAAASFFPIIVLGIFWKRCNREGAIAGMSIGLIFTALMILLMRSTQILGTAEPMMDSFFGINAQGIGTIGMVLNFIVTVTVSKLTDPPPTEVQSMVEQIRYPRIMRDDELT